MKKIVATVAACLATTARRPPAQALELLTNGNFETGTFAGWTLSTQAGSSGSLSLDAPGTTTLLAGFDTAANASGYSFHEVTDQGDSGAYALTQAFTVAASTAALALSFQMVITNYAGQIIVGSQGLDCSGGANQHVRGAILRDGANPFQHRRRRCAREPVPGR